MIAAALLYLALLAFAASQRPHRARLTGPSWLPDDPAIRRVAIAILLVSLGFAVWRGWPIGFVTWCGLLPLFAGIILLSLTYAPWLARGGAIVAAIAVIAGAML